MTMTYWVLRLHDDDICRRQTVSECGYEPDDDKYDSGFDDYDTAISFAATLTQDTGGIYAVVEVRDMFCPVKDGDATDIFRTHETIDGPEISIGTTDRGDNNVQT
jgi:hypothetical protein